MYIFIAHVKILYKMNRTETTLHRKTTLPVAIIFFRLLTKKNLMKLYKPWAYNQVFTIFIFHIQEGGGGGRVGGGFHRQPRNPLVKHPCLLQYINNTHAHYSITPLLHYSHTKS